MLGVMTRVSRRVALDYQSHNPENSCLHHQKQIPAIHTMLIRDVFFKPKSTCPPKPVLFGAELVCFTLILVFYSINYKVKCKIHLCILVLTMCL